MNAKWLLAITIGTLAGVVLADESQLQLKSGPGRDQVLGYCVQCHSVDYIQSNAPFMNRQVWEAEVTKMIKAYGAQIPADEVPRTVDYLVANYGPAPAK